MRRFKVQLTGWVLDETIRGRNLQWVFWEGTSHMLPPNRIWGTKNLWRNSAFPQQDLWSNFSLELFPLKLMELVLVLQRRTCLTAWMCSAIRSISAVAFLICDVRLSDTCWYLLFGLCLLFTATFDWVYSRYFSLRQSHNVPGTLGCSENTDKMGHDNL